MATDVAVAVAVLALLGPRVPAAGAELLLLTAAIVDDIIATGVIAVFYTDSASLAWLPGALAGLVMVSVLRRPGVFAGSLIAALVGAATTLIAGRGSTPAPGQGPTGAGTVRGRSLLDVVLVVALLVLGARFLVDAAAQVAQALGLSDLVIALPVLAAAPVAGHGICDVHTRRAGGYDRRLRPRELGRRRSCPS